MWSTNEDRERAEWQAAEEEAEVVPLEARIALTRIRIKEYEAQVRGTDRASMRAMARAHHLREVVEELEYRLERGAA